MQVFDAHCDVLCKMLIHSDISFTQDSRLDVTLDRLIAGNVRLQNFAIYLPRSLGELQFQHIERSIELFNEKIMSHPSFIHIKDQASLEQMFAEPQKIGAMLSLEGVEGLNGNLDRLHQIYKMGVRSIGITWNYANWAADGVLEPRQGAFTLLGRTLLEECEALGMVLDVSHLSESGFWELVERTSNPFIASHSNAYTVCNHPRNLKDEQIKALIQRKGVIGITFVPWFVKDSAHEVTPEQLIPHIEHICELGGTDHIVFGSDFDGIDHWVKGLEHPGEFPKLYELLCKYYDERSVDAWMGGNYQRFLQAELPRSVA